MNSTVEDQLLLAQEAAQLAGKIIVYRIGLTAISEKADNNLVTEADYAAQEAIITAIKDHYPDHYFLAEENDLLANIEATNLWIIDPLDGTNNYAHKIPHFCVSIAYARLGQVEAGVVFDPVRNEMFSAMKIWDLSSMENRSMYRKQLPCRKRSSPPASIMIAGQS